MTPVLLFGGGEMEKEKSSFIGCFDPQFDVLKIAKGIKNMILVSSLEY